jgi:hypothetical protein
MWPGGWHGCVYVCMRVCILAVASLQAMGFNISVLGLSLYKVHPRARSPGCASQECISDKGHCIRHEVASGMYYVCVLQKEQQAQVAADATLPHSRACR